jgi:hypothetical protein
VISSTGVLTKSFTLCGTVGKAGGILIDGSSSKCTVTDCIITSCDGLWLDGTQCIISENIFSNDIDGILSVRDGGNGDNLVYRNIIANNKFGIECLNSLGSNNIAIAYENNITDNVYGVDCYNSSNNKFYHNNFINNIRDEYPEKPLNWTQVWDDGYPSGGNYWTDYNGTDTRRGLHQNETGSDGIGDTPFFIDTNNVDNYPLTKPFPPASHDIGITSVATSENVTGPGKDVSINLMMFNYGNHTEDFNITFYASGTTIGEAKNMELTSRDFANVTIVWDTSDFAPGNYIISAYAWPVPGETDTADNTYVDGTVQLIMALSVGGGRTSYLQ